jgi:hypothetical protein
MKNTSLEHCQQIPIIRVQMRHGCCEWQLCALTKHTHVKSVFICTEKKYEVNLRLTRRVRN